MASGYLLYHRLSQLSTNNEVGGEGGVVTCILGTPFPLCPEGGVLHVCGRCLHFIVGVVYTVRGYESLVTSNFIL